MAEENAWHEATEPENAPVDAPVEAIQNEAIDRTGLEEDGTLQEVLEEEDPDAWRTIRLEEDAGQVHRILMDAAERSPAVKRALASATSLKQRREAAEREQELVERAEAAERRAKNIEVAAGDRFWGAMTPEARAAHLGRNPQDLPSWNYYAQLKRETMEQQKQPQLPTWVKNTVNDANELVDRYAPHLPEHYEEQLRNTLRDPKVFASYADRPHQLIIDLKESIDTALQGINNGGVQVDATPRALAPTNSGQARNGSRVQASPANPGIGKFAPDATRRSVPSGGGKTLTRAEFEAMDAFSDDYANLLARHGAKTGQELYRRGIIVD